MLFIKVICVTQAHKHVTNESKPRSRHLSALPVLGLIPSDFLIQFYFIYKCLSIKTNQRMQSPATGYITDTNKM